VLLSIQKTALGFGRTFSSLYPGRLYAEDSTSDKLSYVAFVQSQSSADSSRIMQCWATCCMHIAPCISLNLPR